jgi:hypothetical protein
VNVKGVVPEALQKKELVLLISRIPHAEAVIRTFADLDSDTRGKPESIKVANVESQPSPLAQYLRGKNMPVTDAAHISHNIFESSAIIRQSTRAFAELDQKFQPSKLTLNAKEALQKLRNAEANRLRAGLTLQREALLQAGISVPVFTQGAVTSDVDLEDEAEQNAKLCHELIAQGGSDSEAAIILNEVAKSLEHLEERARQNSSAENSVPSSLPSNAQDKN